MGKTRNRCGQGEVTDSSETGNDGGAPRNADTTALREARIPTVPRRALSKTEREMAGHLLSNMLRAAES